MAVQRIIARENLIANAATMGKRLGSGLHALLKDHPHVGDIRGRGMLWALEFVEDRTTKEPFAPEKRVAAQIHTTGMTERWNIFLYPGTGTAD